MGEWGHGVYWGSLETRHAAGGDRVSILCRLVLNSPEWLYRCLSEGGELLDDFCGFSAEICGETELESGFNDGFAG